MTAHLPECPLFRPCRGNANGNHIPQGTVAGIPVTICGMCMHDCICPALRACTVRVLGEAREAVPHSDVCMSLLSENHFCDCYRAITDRAIDRLAQEAP